jgi:DNA-binding beta-propeller fold protein YncE
VVNGEAFRLLGAVDVGLSPGSAEASVRQGLVYVSNEDSGTVSVIRDG